ncbi:MAG TPA: hypothetical protein VGM73_04080 [Candidatus Didemnitutus sp.]|jgi:hypothetical protein
MSSTTISVAGRSGRLFEGEFPETYCFVPQECILEDGESVRLEELDYVVSGWDVRNMRFNQSGEGEHLFPDIHRPVNDLGSEGVRVFLDRIQVVGSR